MIQAIYAALLPFKASAFPDHAVHDQCWWDIHWQAQGWRDAMERMMFGLAGLGQPASGTAKTFAGLEALITTANGQPGIGVELESDSE